jgi:malic enzyme
VLAALVFAAVSMAASWTGWVSDEKCGAKGANAAHAGCAKQCIKAGVKPAAKSDSSN